MKLGQFKRGGDDGEQGLRQQQRFNATARDYPRDCSLAELFRLQVERDPDAPAVLEDAASYSYRELDQASDRGADFLLGQGVVAEERVAVLLDRPFELVTSLLAILKAGAAYLPLDPRTPLRRLRQMVEGAGVRIVIGERRYLHLLTRLQWESAGVEVVLCVDSDDFDAELERDGATERATWELVGRSAFDDISGGGWMNSYTGEWLGREVMDQYGDNILHKLRPHLTPQSRLLEVAVGSGISLVRLAPLVAEYVATDQSAATLEWTRREMERQGITNAHYHCLPAHELDRLDEGGFDLIILNSVIQCFPGYNYLRAVLRQAVALLAPGGRLFLGNLWDLDRRDLFEASLRAFERDNLGKGYRTKVDRSGDLFVSRQFIESLRHELPGMARIEFSDLIGPVRSELTDWTFDAVIGFADDLAAAAGSAGRRGYDRRAVATAPGALPRNPVGGGSLAYVIHTSGTTGRPKGVMVEQRAVARLVINSDYLQLTPADRVLQTGSIAFDASTLEIWGPLLNGGAVAMLPPRALLDPAEVRRQIRRHQITTLWLTASLFNQFADRDLNLFEGLRHLLVGGERLSPPHINRVRARYPGLVIINGYGPTENTTFSLCHRIEQEYQGEIPIGKPIANSEAWVVLEDGRAAAIGVRGEICVAGDGLARGYLNDPELTASRFVPHLLDPEQRMYRTGDAGAWRADGTVDYQGRMDEQLKVRGFRIEPAEIVQRLLQEPRLRDAAVVGLSGTDGTELVAYLVGEAEEAELRARLHGELPDYMVPSWFVRLERLPLTTNGKLDRTALPPPQRSLDPQQPRRLPDNPVEEQLVAIWQQILGREGIGTEDNFFDAGGHSLRVTEVVAAVEKSFGVAIPLTIFFNHPTIRELADQVIDRARFGDPALDEPLVPLSVAGDGPLLFAFPPGTGDAIGFLQWSAAMRPWRVWGFNFIAAPERMARYADLIQQVDPTGPYRLFGYSSGGNLAYHVAAELERRGLQVAAIVMADSGRKLLPMQFPAGQVEQIIDDFLDHESNQALLNAPHLKTRAERLIRASYDWVATAVDHHRVAAPIEVLLSEEPVLEAHDPSGELLSSVSGWAAVTAGGLRLEQGVGSHNTMLYSPYVERNAELIAAALARTRS